MIGVMDILKFAGTFILIEIAVGVVIVVGVLISGIIRAVIRG